MSKQIADSHLSNQLNSMMLLAKLEQDRAKKLAMLESSKAQTVLLVDMQESLKQKLLITERLKKDLGEAKIIFDKKILTADEVCSAKIKELDHQINQLFKKCEEVNKLIQNESIIRQKAYAKQSSEEENALLAKFKNDIISIGSQGNDVVRFDMCKKLSQEHASRIEEISKKFEKKVKEDLENTMQKLEENNANYKKESGKMQIYRDSILQEHSLTCKKEIEEYCQTHNKLIEEYESQLKPLADENEHQEKSLKVG